MFDERDPMRAVSAHDFLILIADLVRTAVTRADDPTHCYSALRSATLAFECSLRGEALAEAKKWHEGMMGDLTEETFAGFAAEAIRDQKTMAVPAETVEALISGATRLVNSAGTPNMFDVLMMLHMAKRMVLAVLVSKNSEDEMGELLLNYTAVKRALARIDFDVTRPVAMVRGGQA
jgi:hypothetical protein